jgi:hypothetical protein
MFCKISPGDSWAAYDATLIERTERPAIIGQHLPGGLRVLCRLGNEAAHLVS